MAQRKSDVDLSENLLTRFLNAGLQLELDKATQTQIQLLLDNVMELVDVEKKKKGLREVDETLEMEKAQYRNRMESLLEREKKLFEN